MTKLRPPGARRLRRHRFRRARTLRRTRTGAGARRRRRWLRHQRDRHRRLRLSLPRRLGIGPRSGAAGLGRRHAITASMSVPGRARSPATPTPMSSSTSMPAMPAMPVRSNMRSGAIAYLYPGGDGTGNVYEGTAPCPTRWARRREAQHQLCARPGESGRRQSLSERRAARRHPDHAVHRLCASLGRERGSFYGRKWDWSLGAGIHPRPVHREPRLCRHQSRQRHLGPGPQHPRRHRGQRQLRILTQPIWSRTGRLRRRNARGHGCARRSRS